MLVESHTESNLRSNFLIHEKLDFDGLYKIAYV